MIIARAVVKEFSDVFQDTELFRGIAMDCQIAIMQNNQVILEKKYQEMKDVFARLSKEMRELDVQIKRNA